MEQNQYIGITDLLEKDLSINKKINKKKNINNFPVVGNPMGPTQSMNNNIKKKYTNLNNIKNKIKQVETEYDNTENEKIMSSYLNWINNNRQLLINNLTELYTFYKLKNFKLIKMKDYYDVDKTDKLFSFSLFITNVKNLSYLIGFVYNYAIMRKHFKDYKMRLYVDFHSVLGSAESFNLFNMFINIIKSIDPRYEDNLQVIVFFLNPYFNISKTSPYMNIVNDLNNVIMYYNSILYNTTNEYIKSPLLNLGQEEDLSNTRAKNVNIQLDEDNLEVEYKLTGEMNKKSSFVMLSCHISINLRFLTMNEDCEFHVRDLDSRLNLTDKNIIKKFNNPKYKYVPYYTFQFYKYYFPFLKWRIDVNPYLAGCFGGDNRKPVMVKNNVETRNNMKVLKKELFFKNILFMSFNATNLQIGFLNDEFILANIFERIKGKYSENVLYLNLGSFSNKHVNEYYYGMNPSKNYPCILKLGTPIDILAYQLNGKYVSIDPITDFKMGNIPFKYRNSLLNLIQQQLKLYLGQNVNINNKKFVDKIRDNYKERLNKPMNDELETALFFSMVAKEFSIKNMDEFDNPNYTHSSYTHQQFSTIGSGTNIVDNQNLKAMNFMMAGYLLADELEEIVFPKNPKYVNSNEYIDNEENYDRLFNCLYFNEKTKKFIQKKIKKDDISRKYVDKNIIEKIPQQYLEFENRNQVRNELDKEFNEYLKSLTYYPSMYNYIQNISFYKYIRINNMLLKTGVLIFIKDYDNKIYDVNDNSITDIGLNDIRTLKYKTNKIEISKHHLRFNLVLLDDVFLNQMIYQNDKNSSKIKINLIKNTHLKNIVQYLQNNNEQNFLIIDKI